MADDSTGWRWDLMLAAFVALGTTAGASALVTSYWTGGEASKNEQSWTSPRTLDSYNEAVEDQVEPEDSTVLEPDGRDDEPSVYDLPDHSGRLVGSIDNDRIGLPRLEADYDIDIRGDLATVVVRQSFKNPTDSTISPVYEFPLYSEAAVYGMTLQIGDRRIEGKVERKKDAREKYEKAKRQGKKAALLDQDRPNLFTQRVANVEPGQKVVVTLRYAHAVPKDRGAYQMTVPLAVPERFTPGDMSDNKLVDGDGADDPGADPGGQSGAGGPNDVELSVRIDGGMPISEVRSLSHRVRVDRYAEADRRIELASTEGEATDRHFRLAYRLSGDRTRVGVNSYWSEDDGEEDGTGGGYFDVLIEPPAEVAASQVSDREMVFVVDKSGSMRGERFEAARDFVERAIDHLRSDDRFRMVFFSNGNETFAGESMRATPENVRRAKKWLTQRRPGGGTRIVPALEEALEPRSAGGRMRLVTVVTDVKVSNEFQVIETVRNDIDDARMFALGVGGDVNRYLLGELGRVGRGFSRQFELDEGRDRFIDDAVRRLQTPVLTDVSVDWGGLRAREVTSTPIPDVFEGGSVRLHGRYSNPGRHTIAIEGTLGGEPVRFEKTVEFADSPHDGEAVKLAWAREQIEDHMISLNTPETLRPEGYDDETLKQTITQLGLAHSLTTQWTSFVAVADDGEVDRGPTQGRKSPESYRDRGNRRRKARKKGRNRRVKQRKAPQPATGRAKGAGAMEFRGGGRNGSGSTGQLGSASSEPADSSDDSASIDMWGPGSGESGGSAVKKRAEAGDKKEVEASVLPHEPNVSGGLDEGIVRRVVRQHRRELKSCYEKELDERPDLSGRIAFEFTIGPSGTVKKASVQKATLDTLAVERCAMRKIEKWTFPSPDGDEDVHVRQSFKFSAN